jgi:dephospho-CoA kinase
VLVAGLTGGIASGKSTVSRMFARSGANVIDADSIARQVVEPDQPAWRAIVDTFGREVICPDGSIDRRRLGDIVFKDANLRQLLEKIVHPDVQAEMESRLRQIRDRTPHAVVIKDIPLLFESGMTGGLDEIVVVYVTPRVQLERLINRDSISKQDARRRIGAQIPLEEKRRWASIVIDNSADRELTARQVARHYAGFAERARKDA